MKDTVLEAGLLTLNWPVPANVRACSTLRGGGISVAPYASLNLAARVGDTAAAVARNRQRMAAAARLPAEPRWLEQVHGTHILDLDAAATNSGAAASPRADGAVTRRAGTVCAVLTADCLPVLLAGVAGDRVGAAHAGWRGLAAGVIEAAVVALREQGPAGARAGAGVVAGAGVGAGAEASGAGASGELIAWLGPAIGPRSFEIGAEVRAALLAGDTALAADRQAVDAVFVPLPGGKYFADLYALARSRLMRVGVTRVHGGGECTYSDPTRYFSHRRDGRTGRQATLIWLE